MINGQLMTFRDQLVQTMEDCPLTSRESSEYKVTHEYISSHQRSMCVSVNIELAKVLSDHYLIRLH